MNKSAIITFQSRLFSNRRMLENEKLKQLAAQAFTARNKAVTDELVARGVSADMATGHAATRTLDGQASDFNKRVIKKLAEAFIKQDRPAKVKQIYKALKREHPNWPAGKKARIANAAYSKMATLATRISPARAILTEKVKQIEQLSQAWKKPKVPSMNTQPIKEAAIKETAIKETTGILRDVDQEGDLKKQVITMPYKKFIDTDLTVLLQRDEEHA